MVDRSIGKETEDIKKLAKTGKLIIGKDRVIKSLKDKDSSLKKVYLASNCPEELSSEIKHYSGLAGTEVVELDIPNDELGIACRKMFPIAVLGMYG